MPSWLSFSVVSSVLLRKFLDPTLSTPFSVPHSVTPAFHRRVCYETDITSCDFPAGTLSEVFCGFSPSSMEMLQLCRKILSYYTNTHTHTHTHIYIYCLHSSKACGPVSSVAIATDHGLDGPGSNPGGDEIFRPSRPVLGPTQPPVQWVRCLSRG